MLLNGSTRNGKWECRPSDGIGVSATLMNMVLHSDCGAPFSP